MTPDTALIVPIRNFSGMTRLAPVLGGPERSKLARTLAERIVTVGAGASGRTIVVSSDRTVAAWASARGADIVEDPGTGLDDAAAAGVAAAGHRPWIVAHADLPFVTTAALRQVVDASTSHHVLVPSLDGGTNVISGRGGFRFAFGPGSFHRHLARAPSATVIASRELSIDIDTPHHWEVISRMPTLPSLAS
jgi:2-phospho-L-lactate/phosphoenolpyruvate guanylyltransferase